jgi:cell division septation protein DedD
MKETQLNFFGSDQDTEGKKRYSVTFGLDTLILIGIVIGLLLTVAFSLGVERGRKIAYVDAKKETIMPVLVKEAPLAVSAEEAAEGIIQPASSHTSAQVAPSTASEKTAKQAPPPVAEKPAQAETPETGYGIQIATYVHQSRADREADDLKTKGYPTIVAKKGEFFVVFVGPFTKKEDAGNKLSTLRKKYSDCFIKTFKN